MCHIPGGKAIMTRKDRPENIRVYLATRVGGATLDAAKILTEQKAALAELFKGVAGCQAERFVRDLVESPEADDLYCQTVSQIRLPEGAWSRGRFVLFGDAAYCPAPIGGGVATTAALVGAYVLAGEIPKQWKKSEQPPGAFSMEEAAKEYERISRPFIVNLK
jgi:2-polyprenyl-6-methoxyphenol hydroxylase-like FAD-dependent oxidoreductase